MKWTPGARPRLRLFCIPYAGVGASVYRPWGRALPPDIEVCALQLPGREGRLRETPFRDLSALLDALVPAIRSWLDVPFAFFGHSMGALVAFEVVRRLRHEGLGESTALFVSGRRAPDLPKRHPPISHLPDREFVEEVVRRYDGIPKEVMAHQELLDLLVPGLKADLALLEAYTFRAGPPLDCALTAFGGRQDAEASDAELVAWRAQTRGPFTVRIFEGGHFFVQAALPQIAQAVVEGLAAQREPRG
jgi:surfactin synthase thioesterase subunit